MVYQNDYRSPSNAAPSVGTVSYFHILTNTDGANKVVQLEDRNYYWRSKVTQGNAWNAISKAKEAVSNATGAFPDDIYTFTITARDAAGNATSKTGRVLLDNWVQQLNITGAAAPNIFFLSGSQFLPNADVPIYAIPTGVTLADGDPISGRCVFVGRVTTDANGTFSNFMVMVPGEEYTSFVADYGGDDIFQPRLDPITSDAAPPGGSLIGGGDEFEQAADEAAPRTIPPTPPSLFLAPDPTPTRPHFSTPNPDPVPTPHIRPAPSDQLEPTPTAERLSTPAANPITSNDVGPDDLLPGEPGLSR